MILYDISVHAYFPGTIFSPGLEEENKTKPKITREIEGTEEGLTPAQCAKGLIKDKRAMPFVQLIKVGVSVPSKCLQYS